MNDMNCGYAVVGNITFDSVSAAQAYCIAHGADINQIDYDSPTAKTRARVCAFYEKKQLEMLLETIDAEIEKRQAAAKSAGNGYMAARKNNSMDVDGMRVTYIEKYSEYGGMCDARHLIFSRIVQLSDIIDRTAGTAQ